MVNIPVDETKEDVSHLTEEITCNRRTSMKFDVLGVGSLVYVTCYGPCWGLKGEIQSEHLCHGWLEGYLLTGRHGVFATHEAFAMVSETV
jgi:hypothetical protein